MVLGVIMVAVKPSPIYAGLGLIVSGAIGCGLLMLNGSSYIGLMVFLIYLGGMLVVFGYTTAMSSDEYPETWGSNIWLWAILLSGIVLDVILIILVLNYEGLDNNLELYSMYDWVSFDGDELVIIREDSVGVGSMYSCGSWMMMVAGWSLLIGVFIIIEITRGV